MEITPNQFLLIRRIAHQLCTRRCGLSSHDCEDLVSELTIIAANRLAKKTSVDCLESFVYRTLMGELVKGCSKTRRRREQEVPITSSDPLAHSHEPISSELEHNEELQVLFEEISRLPSRLQAAVSIRLGGGSRRDYYNEKRAIQQLRAFFRRRNLL